MSTLSFFLNRYSGKVLVVAVVVAKRQPVKACRAVFYLMLKHFLIKALAAFGNANQINLLI